MVGNLLKSSRWSKGSVRRFLVRQAALLVSVVAMGCLSRIYLLERLSLVRNEAGGLLDVATEGVRDDIAKCAAELRELSEATAMVQAASASRSRPYRFLLALAESLPAGAWATSVHVHGDEVEIVGSAESESAVRATVLSLESGAHVSGVQLESTNSSALMDSPAIIEFRVTARVATQLEGGPD